MPDLTLDQQSCSNCNAYRPHLDRTGGKCHLNPPIRIKDDLGVAAAWPPTVANGWCRQWELHPNGARMAFVPEVVPTILEQISDAAKHELAKEPPQDAPYDPPQAEPVAAVEPPAATATEPALTRPPSGKASHQKWKREPAPSDATAKPEELK